MIATNVTTVHRWVRRWLTVGVLAALTVLAGPVTAAQPVPARSGTAQQLAKIDALFGQWDGTHAPGGAVAVIQDEQVVFARGYGMADLEQGVPITVDTVFSLASVSKQFTAAATLLLVDAGRLRLDDKVRTYIPELPEYASQVTVSHLLHHTSGIRDFFQLRALAGHSDADTLSMSEVLRLLSRQHGLIFAPGESYAYSNTGYELLGLLVERVSGQSLQVFCEQNIFRPLGMAHTQFYDDRSKIIPRRAVGHMFRPDGTLGIFRSSFALVGSGGLMSTVGDLALWDANFYHNILGRDRARFSQLQLATVPLKDGTPSKYAAGLIIGSYRGLPTVLHAGRSFGFRTQMVRFPQQHFSVIVLSNRYDADPQTLIDAITDLWLGDKFTQPAVPPPTARPPAAKAAPAQMEASKLSGYAGKYYNDELDATYVVQPCGGGLCIQVLDAAPQPFNVERPDVFVSAQTDLIRATFTRKGRRIDGFNFDHGALRNLRFERQP